jgi:hypothetical protein
MFTPPTIPPKKPEEKPPVSVRDVITERGIARLHELHHRAALANGAGPVQREALRASQGLEHEWRNERKVPVSICVEIVTPGALGAYALIDGEQIVADTPGARSQIVILNTSDTVRIVFSDASIIASLIIATPLKPPE